MTDPTFDGDAPWWTRSLVSDPMAVMALLLAVLATIFVVERSPLRGVYRVVPILAFCYFVPTALSNTGVIPSVPPEDGLPGFPLYAWVMDWLLPSSLLLLILAVDVKAIVGLGRHAILMFLTAAGSIVVGGPLALLALGWAFPTEHADQAWRGLAALCGSWIGGGANFASIGRSVGASDTTLAVIVVVDVAIAQAWMLLLLFLSGRSRELDARIGADTRSVDAVRARSEAYQAEVAAPTDLPALLSIVALAFGGTVVATGLADRLAAWLPENDILGPFAWKIVLVTLIGLAASFTPARRLEGKGASKLGALFLYVLVATIGAKAEFAKVFDAHNLPLVAIAALWMVFHAVIVLFVRRRLRSPLFFAAVGSKACIGGAASAPIIASAFSPALAPVGALLAIAGYVLGTVGGLASAWMLERVHALWHG